MIDGTLPGTLHVRIDHHSAVQAAADQARALAVHLRMPGAQPDRAAVLASELASNISKHAHNGAIFLQPAPLGTGLDVIAVDHGPGIGDIGLSLTDGYSTTRTLGAGLGAVRRIATDFDIRSDPRHGTLAHARLLLPGSPKPTADIGALCLPADGQPVCGDGYALAHHGDARTALVVDGLGHGPDAEAATQRALRTFRACSDAPLPHIISALHKALRHTRGAAAAALRTASGRAEYCCVGNIRAAVLSPRGVRQQLTGQPGIVGYHHPQPQSRSFELPPDTTVALYTDGIDHRWTHAPSPAHLSLPPALLAASLAHTRRRSRDDATVLAFGASLGIT
ncbi:SpoIIE family protein phosphatase [Streptomyces sp. NPDC016459]|uniref:SpoIIE family protein phosphatase n=1 Tax=Streptomyces sp. NPDC016459 TaxID=3157190 RepID=UPI0033ECE38E